MILEEEYILKKLGWILAICIAVVTVFSGCRKADGTKSDNYEIGPDRIPSVSFVLGDREQTAFEEKDGVMKYTYKTDEEGYMDIYEYMSYLIDNCGGVVTVALNEGKEGECEIAMESEESGYAVKMGFEYKPDGYCITISRVAGKIKTDV